MKGRKYSLLTSLLFFIFISCNEEPELDKDLWVGTNRVLDRNIPFPFLLQRTGDNLYLIDHKNQIIDSTAQLQEVYESRDTIRMQNHEFVVVKFGSDLLLFDIRDSLNFPYHHPLYAAQFVKVGKSEEIDLAALHKKFQKNTYQAEVNSAHFATPNRDLKVVKTMKFSEDSVQTIYTYYYQNELVYAEKEVSKYHLFERKGKFFLSEGQESERHQTLYQISGVNDNSFSLRSFRNNEEVLEHLKVSEEIHIPSEVQVFERCMEGQPGEYYHDNLTYTKGNEYLIRKIGENAPAASGDGYITVHFTINCKGEMGHPGLEQMDREFQSTSFDPALVQHILTKVMELKAWPEVKPGLSYKDIHSFLMFRIKNGKINDLCP